MHIDQTTYRQLWNMAKWAFVIGIAALWLPLSWQTLPNQSGTHTVHLDLGVLQPLRATWQSSAAGFWFGFSEVRFLALALTTVFTVAALTAVRESTRRCACPG
jgi:hypothetical protein